MESQEAEFFESSLWNGTLLGLPESGSEIESVGGLPGNSSGLSDAAGGISSFGEGYCGNSLRTLSKSYRTVHGYTSVMVCLFGAQANILNLIVLTRRDMINPTNAILTGLALADLLNMLEYIPYAVYLILPGSKTTYAWALFVLIHSNFSQVCHTISIWLTVTLAVWRYIMVAMHTKCRTLCSMVRAKYAIASAYFISPLLCFPIYLSFSITPHKILAAKVINSVNSTAAALGIRDSASISTSSSTSTFDNFNSNSSSESSQSSTTSTNVNYIVNLSELAKSTPILMTANFWLYSVVIKIIPCILLTIVSFRLINSLLEAKKRKEMLLKKRHTAANAVTATTVSTSSHPNNSHSGGGGGDHGGDSGGSDRTTRMLLAVLLLFLITEFPQGMLGLLSGLLGDAFFQSCYIPLADLMDFIALLNSAINFILYCAMSQKFRDTFTQVFHLNTLLKWGRRQREGLGSVGGRVHDVRSSAKPVNVPVNSVEMT